MTAGLLQLVAKGPDDIYIIDEPQITFFKIVYRRHSNFCMYPNYLHFDKELDFGQESRCRLQSRGDIVTQLYLEIILPEIFMKLKKVSRGEIKSILKKYLIDWKYDNPDSDIVTIEIYNNEILPLINNKIEFLINKKNFYEEQKLILKKSEKYFEPSMESYISLNSKLKKSRATIKPKYKISKNEQNSWQIIHGLALVNFIINENIKQSEYYNLFIYLVNKINQLIIEEQQFITEVTLFNFDDIYNILYNTITLLLSAQYEEEYLNLTDIYDYGDILLYNVIDQGNYVFLKQNVGNDVAVYFNNIIGESLNTTEFDNLIMSFVVMKEYFNYLSQNKQTINNEFDITRYKIDILNNIEWNIKKNIKTITSLLSIIENNKTESNESFRIGVMKTFVFESNEIYDGDSEFNIIKNNNIINDKDLTDFFGDYLVEYKLPGEAQNIHHFFGKKIHNRFKKMMDDITLNYTISNDPLYSTNINLWNKLVIKKDTVIDSEYKGILLMNLVPIILISEIPEYMYEKIFEDELLKKYHTYFKENGIIKETSDKLINLITLDHLINGSMQTYLKSVKKNFVKNEDQVLLSIFCPEIFYTLDDIMFDDNFVLLMEFEKENKLNQNLGFERLLALEYILFMYIIKYFDIVDTFIIDLEHANTIKKNLYDKLKIFRYIDFYGSLPLYESYKANNYSLYKINNNVYEDIEIRAEPKYIDAICSLYYYLQKKNIEEYNKYFNTVLKPDYIQNNVGLQMSKIIYNLNENIPGINYFYDNDEIGIRAGMTIINYLNKYIKLFGRDLFIYKRNKNIYEIKNIIFKKRIINYFKTKDEMKEYIIEELLSTSSSYNIVANEINEIVKNYSVDQYNTVAEYLGQLLIEKIDEFDKELLNDIIIKNFNFNDSTKMYFEQKKLGIFNSLKNKDEVLQFIIYLISDRLDLSYLYKYVYLYRDNDIITVELYEIYFASLTNDQLEELLDPDVYNYYYNVSIRISVDYNVSLTTEEGIQKYYKILDNFTTTEYIKYNITKNDINILKLVPLISYDKLRIIIFDKNKVKKIRDTVELLNIKMENLKEEDYTSLINTHKNLEKFYSEEIIKIDTVLNNMTIKHSTKLEKKKIKLKDISYNGSKLEEQLLKLINSDQIDFRWAKEIGHLIIDNISIQIGEQIIESHDSDWNRAQHLIFNRPNQKKGYDRMIGNVPEIFLSSKNIGGVMKSEYILQIPINFWFSKYYSTGLPLVATPYSDIDIIVKLKNLDEVAYWNDNTEFIKKPKLKCQILANYICVEEEERKRLCETRLEYLIEMLQKNGEIIIGRNNISNTSFTADIYFNNSSKFIYWQLKFTKNIMTKDEKFNWTDDTTYISEKKVNNITNDETVFYKQINPIKGVTIKFNGKNREAKKDYEYYNWVQPYKCKSGNLSDNMFIYTFALDITKYQPSGSVNMSKINNLSIVIELDEIIINEINIGNIIAKMKVYNYSYNILRIMSGLAGLAFYS